MTSVPIRATLQRQPRFRPRLKLASLGHVRFPLLLQILMTTCTQSHVIDRDGSQGVVLAPPISSLSAPLTVFAPESVRDAYRVDVAQTSNNHETDYLRANLVPDGELALTPQKHKIPVSATGSTDSSGYRSATHPDSESDLHADSLYFRKGSSAGLDSGNKLIGNLLRLNTVDKIFSDVKYYILEVFNTVSSKLPSLRAEEIKGGFERNSSHNYRYPVKKNEKSSPRNIHRDSHGAPEKRRGPKVSTRKSRRRRSAPTTSKFTGLVVGATENKNLQSSVARFLQDLEKSIWQQQSNVTRAFSVNHPASILGSFSSTVLTNFRGKPQEAELRHDPQYELPDVNALTQLLVLNCLTEAGIYGSAQNPDVSEVLDMLSSLDAFHIQGRMGGSALITMWPEQLMEGSEGWRSYPENLLLTAVKNRNTLRQLQNLASTCDSCHTSKQGLNSINRDRLCSSYFATPLRDVVVSKGTPPDVMNSFANLALGAIFNAKIRLEDQTDKQVFATELAQWSNSNAKIDLLIKKLKKMVIVFPSTAASSSTQPPPQTTPTLTSTSTSTTTTTTTMAPTTVATTSNTTTSTASPSTTTTTTERVPLPKPIATHSTNQTMPAESEPEEPNHANLQATTSSLTATNSTERLNVSSSTTLEAGNVTSRDDDDTNSSRAVGGEEPSILGGAVDNDVDRKNQDKMEGKENGTFSEDDIQALVSGLFGSEINETNSTVKASSRKRRSVVNNENTTSEEIGGRNNTSEKIDEEKEEKEEETKDSALNSTAATEPEQISPPTPAWSTTTPTPNSRNQNSKSALDQPERTDQGNGTFNDISSPTETQGLAGELKPVDNGTLTSVSDLDNSTSLELNPLLTKDYSRVQDELHQNNVSAGGSLTEAPHTSTLGSKIEVRSISLTSSTSTAATTTLVTTNSPPETTSARPTTETKTQTPPPTTPPAVTTPSSSGAGHVNQVVDSVSYFALREYLDDVLPSATEDVLMIPSMLSDSPEDFIIQEPGISEQSSRSSDPSSEYSRAADDGDLWHNGQVFCRYNSVDPTSTATAVHALVVSSMAGLVDLQTDLQLQRILRSSLHYLTWLVTHPDNLLTSVALSRFPSRFQLYLVLSRITFQLTSMQSRDSDLFDFASTEIKNFLDAVHGPMTFAILDSIKDGGLGTDGRTRVYIDDFVGTADFEENGKPKVSGDDRVFSSAVAASTLIFSWTTQDKDGSLKFDKDIQDPVRIAVNSLVNFVIGKVLNDGDRHTSVLMSDLVKNCDTLLSRFPYNTVSTIEGNPVETPQADGKLRFGVRGYIPKQVYEAQLSSNQFGKKAPSPTVARKLNSPSSYFRIWSSLVYTRAVSLMAVSLAANLQVDGDE